MIRITLANSGTESDTYTLSIRDSQDLPLRDPLEVEVEALGSLDFDLDVKLPSRADETEAVTIKAVSLSDPEISAETEVNLVASRIPGDMDNNKSLDLGDAVQMLKVLTGNDTGDIPVYTDADVNGNGKLGLEEFIYILMCLAE